VTNAAQQFEPRAGDLLKHPLGALVEDEAITIAPNQQHGNLDPLQHVGVAELPDQPPGGLQVAGDGGPVPVVRGEGRDDAAIDRVRGAEGQLQVQARHRGPQDRARHGSRSESSVRSTGSR